MSRDEKPEVNDLSSSAVEGDRRRCCGPVPTAVPCVLFPLLLAGIGVSVFILAVVHNALLLVALLLISALVAAFFLWNAASQRSNRALRVFLDRFPASDLRTAADGQLVKITGFASCCDVSLVSSYEKVERCVYTSTSLYTYSGCKSYLANAKNRCFRWNLTYLERLAADFYITDAKSGTRALVKAGSNSKVIPLVDENILVNTTLRNRELSSTLKNWLEERHFSADSLLRLEEGYIKEGRSLTVMGMLSRKSGAIMIVPLPEPIATGCLLQNLLLPVDVDGLLLKISDKNLFMPNLAVS
ncbi:uncharacterized membrane protein At1g16860-like [Typha latifolia]|uniref:uncharacterized membrane protein At1g16860-like n=1 Tax=Typha latifolia TaxID=4733 RepID=UPI003C2FB186